MISNWFKSQQKPPASLYESILNYFIYSYADIFMDYVFKTYMVVFGLGVIVGLSPLLCCYGGKILKCGCRYILILWIVACIIITLNIVEFNRNFQ